MFGWVKKPIGQLILLMIGFFFLGLPIGFFAGKGDLTIGEREILGFVAFVLVLSIVATPFYFRYWRSLDELAQHAHRWAFNVGGQYGMVVSALIFTLALLLAPGALPDVLRDASFAIGFVTGILVIIYGACFGYWGMWAWFWWKKR